jgi:hypothetical protein
MARIGLRAAKNRKSIIEIAACLARPCGLTRTIVGPPGILQLGALPATSGLGTGDFRPALT